MNEIKNQVNMHFEKKLAKLSEESINAFRIKRNWKNNISDIDAFIINEQEPDKYKVWFDDELEIVIFDFSQKLFSYLEKIGYKIIDNIVKQVEITTNKNSIMLRKLRRYERIIYTYQLAHNLTTFEFVIKFIG